MEKAETGLKDLFLHSARAYLTLSMDMKMSVCENYPFQFQHHKMVEHTQTIRWQR